MRNREATTGTQLPLDGVTGGKVPEPKPKRKIVAEKPLLRASGTGIEGVWLSPRKLVTTSRMAKIIHKLGLSGAQFYAWTGFSVGDWLKHNPRWTERQFAELVIENLERISVEVK